MTVESKRLRGHGERRALRTAEAERASEPCADSDPALLGGPGSRDPKGGSGGLSTARRSALSRRGCRVNTSDLSCAGTVRLLVRRTLRSGDPD